MDQQIADQLAIRDRFRGRIWAAQSWEERLVALDRHLTSSEATMRTSPQGYAHFLRRNYRKRSTDWTDPTERA
jgi:hypothetical protein